MPAIAYALEAPACLVFDGRKADVGATVYRALALLANKGGSAPITEICQDVWNVPEVARRSVHSLVHRVNEKLDAVGCDLRCAVDGPEMRLY
ncbi:hypothetical protein VT84_03520 [Gemmata sp. SH-PL17]|nr:hypothetical protein VT84_03520 [Gemmata sp. SH-PL17]